MPGTTPKRASLVATVGGAAAGLTAGLFGVGGGVLLVPLLALVVGLPQHAAHATSLAAIIPAAIAGVIRFGVDGSVSLPGAAALALGAVVGARVGGTLLPKLTESGLRRLFGIVLIVLALRFLVVGASGAAAAEGGFVPDQDAVSLALHALGGLAAGVTSAVLGVGGGVLLVPLLVIGFGYGQHVAEGTSLAVIIPTAITGAVTHHRRGYTHWRLGAQLGLAAAVGSALGASVALALSPVTLGRLYGVLQLVVGALMLRRPPGSETTVTDV